MILRLEIEREEDGRWLAEVVDLSGAMAYGATPAAALSAIKALALRVIADKIEHNEIDSDFAGLSFVAMQR